MLKNSLENLKQEIIRDGKPVILFGAGDIGEMCDFSFRQHNVKVDFFCDSSEEKQGKIFCDKKVLSPSQLDDFGTDAKIFISNNYYPLLKKELKSRGFQNIYNCSEFLKNTDFSKSKLKLQPLKIERWVEFYNSMIMKEEFLEKSLLHIKSLDVQVTEKCSLKCKDCSNLMQYYSKVKDSDYDIMVKSIDRFMKCVDNIYEFRVLGGDPFMNKEMHKVINYLSDYEKVKKIAIYTNARFLPKGENFECLKNPKVVLDISDYVLIDKSKRKADELIEQLEKNKINYTVARMDTWTDSGRILPFQKRSEQELKRVFNYCCNSDILSLLHGKLYRCPFSANGTNLKAIPFEKSDVVDLSDENIPLDKLKLMIKNLAFEKDYLMACNFCNGRDYTTKNIKAAEQSTKKITFKQYQ